jgi:hypothetical protein
MTPALFGIAAGAAAALVSARVLEKLVFGVSASDSADPGNRRRNLALVALLASMIPAYRASRVDPLAVLRRELIAPAVRLRPEFAMSGLRRTFGWPCQPSRLPNPSLVISRRRNSGVALVSPGAPACLTESLDARLRTPRVRRPSALHSASTHARHLPAAARSAGRTGQGYRFPGVPLGTATAAYQVEGAANDDGRLPSDVGRLLAHRGKDGERRHR